MILHWFAVDKGMADLCQGMRLNSDCGCKANITAIGIVQKDAKGPSILATRGCMKFIII